MRLNGPSGSQRTEVARNPKKRVTIDPRRMHATLQQAIALHRAGRLDEADKLYQELLKSIPDQADALNLSGLISFQQGKAARAIVLLNRAVAARPKFADALNHLGMAQRKLGQTPEALKSFAQSVEAEPGNAEAHNNLGNARKDMGDLEGAATAYRQAVSLAPHAAEPRYNLGNVLRDLEDHDGAMAAYAEVLDLTPNHVEARINLAGLLERRHELDRALSEVETALRQQPGLAPAHILKGKVLRRLKRIDEAEAVLQGLENVDLVQDDAINWGVERGKLFDLTDRADAAFAAFAEVNRLQLRAGGKRLRRQAEQFRQQISRDLEWLEAGAGWEPEANSAGEGLVFLVGFPRSGTTLLDQVLDAHPDVAVMEERPAATQMLAEAKAMRHNLPGALVDLNQLDAEQLQASYFAEVDKYVDRSAASVLVDKMPLNIVHVLPLARLFPQAKFVLALRHPLDVVLSNFMQLYRLNGAMANFLTVETAAETYDLTMRLWQMAAERLPLQVHEVRYESLIANMESESRALLAYLGVEWTGTVLDPTGHARSRKIINTPSYEQVAEPIYQRANGRWTRYEQHLQPVRRQLDPWVERLGYSAES